ncbi:MAG: alkaline phosphatase family protein [Amphiplicatus sp.]
MDGEKTSFGCGPKAFLACVDAFSLPFARAHLDQLPTLRVMLERGAFAPLQSPAVLMSASMWPTFMTGADPGEHGQYHPFQWDAAAMRFRRVADPHWSRRFHIEPFWHRLQRAGVETVALDASFSLHDEAAPCLQISNWSGQETGAVRASDPTLMVEIQRRFGRRPIGPEVPVPKTRVQSAKLRDQLIHSLRLKTEALFWLMEKKPDWRFFLAGFFEAHRGGHNLWPTEGAFASEVDRDALLEVYKELDHQLGCIFEKVSAKGATVILCALHGMAANRAQNHFLPQLVSRLNALYLKERGVAVKPQGAGDDVVSVLRKTVPYSAQYALAKFLGEEVQDWVVNRGVVAGRDWRKTPALHLVSGGEGYIRLNIKGREAQGYFEPGSEELRQYKHWLRARLLAVRVAETGAPLIKAVHDVDDRWPGPRRSYLPDFMLEWAPAAPVEKIVSPDIGEITERLTTGRGGNHTGEAFMIVKGPHAADLSDVAHIRDIGGFVERLFAARPAIRARAVSLA